VLVVEEADTVPVLAIDELEEVDEGAAATWAES